MIRKHKKKSVIENEVIMETTFVSGQKVWIGAGNTLA